MKITCRCGEIILDQTDYLPHKAHFIPDQEWFNVLDAIDEAIEKSGPSAKEKEAACMRIRSLLRALARSAWQCSACGCIYADDQDRKLHLLIPGDADVPKEMFRFRNDSVQ